MDEIPLLVDTEAETSVDLDEEKIHKKFSSTAVTQNATTTLFNIAFDNLDDEDEESVEFKDYESRLRQNMKDWKFVYLNAYKDLKQSKQKHPVVDKSILPPEKLKYLDEAINLQNFVRESLEFRQQATLFLEYEYAEFIEMQENMEIFYEHKLNLIKSNKIAENLANVTK